MTKRTLPKFPKFKSSVLLPPRQFVHNSFDVDRGSLYLDDLDLFPFNKLRFIVDRKGCPCRTEYLYSTFIEPPAACRGHGSDLAGQGLVMAPGFYYGLLVLSPSASKLAFIGGAGKEGSTTLRIYDLKKGETLALDKPDYSFLVDRPITELEWSPDEGSVAVVAFEQDGALAIKVLEVATAGWQELVRLQMDWSGGAAEWLSLLKIISWTL